MSHIDCTQATPDIWYYNSNIIVPSLEGTPKIYECGEVSLNCIVNIDIPYEYYEDEDVRNEWAPKLDYHLIFSLAPIDNLDSSHWVKDISVFVMWIGPVDVINLMDGGDDIYIRAFYMHEENHTHGTFSNQLHYNLQSHYDFTLEDYYACLEEESSPTPPDSVTTDNSPNTQPPPSNTSQESNFFSNLWGYIKFFGVIGVIFFAIILFSTLSESNDRTPIPRYKRREINAVSRNHRSNHPHYSQQQKKRKRTSQERNHTPPTIRRNTRKIEQKFKTIIQKIDEKYLSLLPQVIRKTNNTIKITPQEFESRKLLHDTILIQLQSSEEWKGKLLDIYLEWQSKVKSKDWRFA
jgi:hypothetical protein